MRLSLASSILFTGIISSLGNPNNDDEDSQSLLRGPPRPLGTSIGRMIQEEPEIPPITCNNVYGFSARPGPGPNSPEGVPGTSGSPRFGIPMDDQSRSSKSGKSPKGKGPKGYDAGGSKGKKLRVRKAWHTLSSEEKEQFVVGVALMRATTPESSLPGNMRAEYATFCSDDYQPSAEYNNLYNFYNELHQSTYKSWGTDEQPYTKRSHQSPQFFPFHRYMLLRFEADMRTVLRDPSFMLPYWDFDQCENDPTCGDLFGEHLGGPGGCADGGESIEDGLLYRLGYRVDVIAESDLTTTYNPDSIRCIEPRPLKREYGCGVNVPSSTLIIKEMSRRLIYDVEPYNSCSVDENVSFRQYVEGFKKQDDPNAPLALEEIQGVLAGQGQHADAHLAVGADLGDQAVPDPIFFLLHANVDRIWAIWQEFNMGEGRTQNHGNPGYPASFMGPIFNFPDVDAEEMFDYTALGYTYDTFWLV